MQFELTGKVALITGASRGIGKSIATAFAKQGADIIINDLPGNVLASETAEQIRSPGRRCEVFGADVTNEQQVKSMFQFVKDTFEKIGQAYINKYLRTCFKEQTEQWDGLDKLSNVEYERLINSKELPDKIKEKLESDEAFLEKFWEAFSSVCFDIIKERKNPK